MSNKDLVFRIKNYKQPNAEVKLNPEGMKLMKRMQSLRAREGDTCNPFDHCNDAEVAFIHAIHSAGMALGAGAEAKDKIADGCDPVIPAGGDIEKTVEPGEVKPAKLSIVEEKE